MSQGASAELPKHPARSLPPNPSKLLLLRRMGPLGEQTKTPLEDLSESDTLSRQAAASPPVPAQRTVFLFQPTETEGASSGCNDRPARPPPPDPLKLQSLRGASLPESLQEPNPKRNDRPARPPAPCFVKLQKLRCSTLPDSSQPASPIGLPSPAMSRSTETPQDFNRPPDASWEEVNSGAAALESGDHHERPTGASLERPARPPPPDHSKIRHLRTEACNPSLEDQDVPMYVHILPEPSPVQDYRGHAEAPPDEAEGGVLYEVPGESRLTDGSTPPKPPPPPLPPVGDRKPFRSFLLSTSEEPVDHVYESIDDVLSEDKDDDGTRSRWSLPAALTNNKHQTYRSWSEQSSVYGDASAVELDLLLDWWRSLGGWEKILTDGRGEQRSFVTLIAQKMKMAMRLYELLIFERGTDLLNHITELHCTAERFVKSNKKTHIAKMTGGTAGAVGGVTVAAGLALAPLTFGASLLAAGAGVGVIAAGGFAGASATLTKKRRGTQLRNKVEKILKNYNSQLEDISECLVFIDRGMERLRAQDQTNLKHLDQHLMKTIQTMLDVDRFGPIERASETSCFLQSLDFYSDRDERAGNQKDSDRKFAEKVHVVADKLKEEINELIRIKNLFRSISDQS